MCLSAGLVYSPCLAAGLVYSPDLAAGLVYSPVLELLSLLGCPGLEFQLS